MKCTASSGYLCDSMSACLKEGHCIKYNERANSEHTKSKATDTQVGGGHYKDFKIQPVEFIMKNNLSFCQGNVIKYICRYKAKGGIEDLKKVKHYVDLIIQLEGYDTGTTKEA